MAKDAYETTTPLLEALRAAVPPERVHGDELALSVYARAADFFEYRPQAVVRTLDEDEVRAVLAVSRDLKVPVTFRAGGTSLSGQVLGTGIICDISEGFQSIEVRDADRLVWTQCGPTGEMVNRILAPLGKRMGPDPASIRACRMGGIVTNNSSGMTAGAVTNAYHTMRSMRVVLADGSVYDSSVPADYERFETEQPTLATGLADLRTEVLADEELTALIKKKFSIKCVTGYSINALVDYDKPLDIFTHLMVGSEGTLGFLSALELETFSLEPDRSTSLLLFKDATTCAQAVKPIEDLGAVALELLDDASMKAAGKFVTGLPDFVYHHPDGSCALLVDFYADTESGVEKLVAHAQPAIKKLDGLLQMSDFTTTPEEHNLLWRVRSDLYGIVAGNRPPGSTAVLEDMAVPLEELPKLVEGLQASFKKAGYDDGLIFGHASAGNMHFLISADFSKDGALEQYKGWIEGLVALVADELHGSLKAEHGTGRAIAPFVEREWGSKAYDVMKRIKALADPDGLVNPGVVIDSDPNLFEEHLKQTPTVTKLIDDCLECGFCEHVCPSRLTGITPRRRIQASRKHAELVAAGKHEQAEALWKEYDFLGIDLCAADGMCQSQCPVHINTGHYTDELRTARNSEAENALFTLLSKHFGAAEHVLRGSMDIGSVADKAGHSMEHVTEALHVLVPWAPIWEESMVTAPPAVSNEIDDPDFVYFPTCVSRIMGASAEGKPSIAETIMTVAERAGMKLYVGADAIGVCCSQIWEHKGFEAGRRIMADRILDRMWEWSRGGELPIIVDTTTCTNTITESLQELFSQPAPYREPGHGSSTGVDDDRHRRYSKLRIIDVTEWLEQDVMPKLTVTARKDSVCIHPTCGCVLSGTDKPMQAVAESCADNVLYPLNWNCCGTAGDRGFLHPELADAAQHYEMAEIAGRAFDGYYSVARTCEISLSDHAGATYEPIVYLVEETTRPEGSES